ncbi:MAG: hypothetical protein MJZ81_11560, partial [Bacteroidales bacterium]|nr:hypothetical protein [Bacteroidales bacterium]
FGQKNFVSLQMWKGGETGEPDRSIYSNIFQYIPIYASSWIWAKNFVSLQMWKEEETGEQVVVNSFQYVS